MQRQATGHGSCRGTGEEVRCFSSEVMWKILIMAGSGRCTNGDVVVPTVFSTILVCGSTLRADKIFGCEVCIYRRILHGLTLLVYGDGTN